ncbi:BON domain-containing protein [Flavobacterium circumlabens]|uniref:BON domain-containing protein n=1 Tax=Flavobacterium circumlabens TaxID=2133765 RepID=A0A4Y7UCW3_9FLAO|nr:BON domain-containing protein [Flavobacterium circumlabens]TCN58882.1 osmotically-inducible protein OsmY [Flavobacterium circumlabens]TEB44290.1 BON domain-containing protein [Flavobacterium circumlabens]
MRTNEELQKDVQNAIKWEPLLHAAEIGVTVKDGVVTLTGTVDGYYKKKEAETAAKNVAGVKAVVEQIEIKYSNNLTKTDNDIANEVLKALKDNWAVSEDHVKVKVEDGWVNLEGELTWNFQKQDAKNCISYLPGVRGVTNDIKIKSDIANAIEKKDIEKALKRAWGVNEKEITVIVDGTHVKLTGFVDSIFQKDQVEQIVWKTPGIWSIDNDLVIEYDYASL